jgi:hypothetical protein
MARRALDLLGLVREGITAMAEFYEDVAAALSATDLRPLRPEAGFRRQARKRGRRLEGGGGLAAGRPTSMTPEKTRVAREMYGSRRYTVEKIASTLGASRASIYRHLGEPGRSGGPAKRREDQPPVPRRG